MFRNYLIAIIILGEIAGTYTKNYLMANDVCFGDVISISLTENGTKFASIWTFINDLSDNP